MPQHGQKAKERYEQLSTTREPFLQRARWNALLTIPSIMPLEGQTDKSHLYEPYQGLGSMGVLNMASRLLMTLLPPGRPFFQLSLPADVELEFLQKNDKIPDEIEKGLRISEKMLQSEVEKSNWRKATTMSLQQLIVTGNVMEEVLPNNNIRVYRLDQYVVNRDFQGNLIEGIIKEPISFVSLPEDVQDKIKSKRNGSEIKPDEEFDLYTRFAREKDAFVLTQEVEGTELPNTETEYDPDELPFFALRWSETPGEDYGRGKIEEHAGDLRSLEALEKSMLEGAAMSSRNVIMVKPNATGGALRKRISKANNGDVLVGDFDRVSMLSFENVRGLQVTQTQVEQIRASLSRAFLLNSSVQRDAERVTATEIQAMIDEIETVLGGVFATLSTEMMRERLKVLIRNMQADEDLPAWEDDQVDPQVLTGLEALNRERDVQRTQMAFQMFSQIPEASDYAPMGDLVQKFLYGLGLPSNVRTEEQAQQFREQRAATDSMKQAIPGVAREAARQQGEQQGGQ